MLRNVGINILNLVLQYKHSWYNYVIELKLNKQLGEIAYGNTDV